MFSDELAAVMQVVQIYHMKILALSTSNTNDEDSQHRLPTQRHATYPAA